MQQSMGVCLFEEDFNIQFIPLVKMNPFVGRGVQEVNRRGAGGGLQFN